MTPQYNVQDLCERMLITALGEIGTRELAGPRSHPRIVEYFASAGIGPNFPGKLGADDSTTPWCGCFAAWVVRQLGVEPPSQPYRARSWANWGAPKEPLPGCVAVFSRPPNPAHGHVAIVLAEVNDGAEVAVCGGNQRNAVTVALYPRSRLLGYRVPELKPMQWGP